MKTAISIPDELFRSTDQAAKRLGLTRSAFIQKALEDFLETQSQKAIVEKLNRVYSKVDSSIPAEIQTYQRRQLQTEEW
jgi:metal-responsive CopG/Arc/MetJ family transcriptional regulator